MALRKIILNLHLYAGLAAAFFLTILGVTGSIMVFEDQIDGWLNPQPVLHPLPERLGELLAGFKKVLLPELNRGQLASLIRARYGVEVIKLPKVCGQPFSVSEIVNAANACLSPAGVNP